MTKTKQSREERLEKKRLAERKRKAKIKSDPLMFEAKKKKDRERYRQNKASKKIVPISQLSKKKREALRERNRINVKAFRARKLQLESASQTEPMIDIENMDTEKESQDPLYITEPSQCHSGIDENSRKRQSSASCSRITRNLRSISRESSKSPVTHLSRSKKRVPKRLNYNIEPLSSSPGLSSCSASSNISRASSISATPRGQRKKLIRKYRYKMSKEFQVLRNRIEELTNLNKRYRKQVSRLRVTNSISLSTNNNNLSESNLSCIDEDETVNQHSKNDDKTKLYKSKLVETIHNFYLDDDNSRMCPGKKEYITKNKIKKQKRYLSESILNLHKKINSTYPHFKVSYSHFWKLKPFWVLTPNLKTRDTCMCKQHENIELMVDCLKRNNIINEKTARDVLTSLCCNLMDPKCLSRECDKCQSKNLKYNEFDNTKHIKYWSWKTVKKQYIKDGQTKTAIQSVKDQISATPKDVVHEFENMLKPFLNHCSNIVSQSAHVKKLKSCLTEKEAVVHCDFSENYGLKYANEIQALHFGGSRQHITLHTVVIYFLLEGNLQTQAFCTISKSLRHDAVAVWEHLMPVLRFIEDKAPSVEAIHFVSDSPSGQYRNRNLFFMISKLHWHYPSLRYVSWNYSESGHGKGAPDGVGAVLKRTADQIVARGHDVPDLESLLCQLKSSVPGVIIEVVEESGILQKEMLIPTLNTFKGTMRVHQVVWDGNNKFKLALRRLSCSLDDCSTTSAECQHGYHIGFFDIGSQADLSEQDVARPELDLEKPRTNEQQKKQKTLSQVATNDSSNNVNVSDNIEKTITPQPTKASMKSFGDGSRKIPKFLDLDHTLHVSGPPHESFSNGDKSAIVINTSGDIIKNTQIKSGKNSGQKGNKRVASTPLKEIFDVHEDQLPLKSPTLRKKITILSNKLINPITSVPQTLKLTVKDTSKKASPLSNDASKIKKSKGSGKKDVKMSAKTILNPVVPSSSKRANASSSDAINSSLIKTDDDDDFWGPVPSIDEIQVTPILQTIEMAHINNVVNEDSDSSDYNIFD